MPIKKILISGRVQGVFFRASAQEKAQKIGELRGTIRNLPDGRVEALVAGPGAKIEQFIKWCHEGPTAAKVSRVEVSDADQKITNATLEIAY
jgi:acylphosphatase